MYRVHIITVNDYLTERDTQWMEPIYRILGLSVGSIVHGMEPEQRRSAYQCDITYCTNKEIVFDYLKDRMVLADRAEPLRLQAEYLYGGQARVNQLLLRGMHFAIVDEADSVLIDEARTPLIISGKGGEEEKTYLEQAMALSAKLERGKDFKLDHQKRQVELTDSGKGRLRRRSDGLGPLWQGMIRREEIVRQALSARHLFRRDEHYLVREGKVEIIDEFTGRVMPDRSWERGLHQLIELKEGCSMSQRHVPLARISYQRFFRRYLKLAGMTGTAREVRRELGAVYGLPVVRIPTNRPVQRRILPDQVFPSLEAKWSAIVERVGHLHRKGCPVLVGTRSVAASEELSRRLAAAGLEHQVLNAKFDADEAQIVARAGEMDRITIATNMAGRGTDIKLEPGTAQMEGLHVILTERHEAGRIDRQLSGRCGRQGDPGTGEAFLSLADPLLEGGLGGWAAQFARRWPKAESALWQVLVRGALRRAQRKTERLHRRIRRELLQQDERWGELLAFSRRRE